MIRARSGIRMATPSQSALPRWPFRLDADKAVEAVLFLAARAKKPTFHTVSKLLYHADRLHLGRYGRPITGDRYVAMKHGPVPSATYNIWKTIRGDERVPIPEAAIDALAVVNGFELRACRGADESVLSQSELECLAESVATHGSKSFAQLTRDSHDAAWHAADENDLYSLEDLLLTLANSDELRTHFHNEEAAVASSS